MRTRTIIAAGAAAAALVVGAAPAGAGPLFYQGEKTAIEYNASPLRTCASTGCQVLAYMPVTTSLQPGGGYATFAKDQSGPNWCEINWKGIVGWTGCWRLSPGTEVTVIG